MTGILVDRGGQPPPPGGGGRTSYANKVGFVRRSHDKMSRNAIEVYLEKKEGVQVTLDNSFINQVMEKIEVSQLEIQGNQAYFLAKGLIVEIWLNQNVSAVRFSSEAEVQLSPGICITRVKPALQQE